MSDHPKVDHVDPVVSLSSRLWLLFKHLLGEQPLQVLSHANELTLPSRRFTTKFVSLGEHGNLQIAHMPRQVEDLRVDLHAKIISLDKSISRMLKVQVDLRICWCLKNISEPVPKKSLSNVHFTRSLVHAILKTMLSQRNWGQCWVTAVAWA